MEPKTSRERLEAAGWAIWQTGGGCTAWGLNLPDGVYALLSDECSHLVDEAQDGVHLALHNENCENQGVEGMPLSWALDFAESLGKAAAAWGGAPVTFCTACQGRSLSDCPECQGGEPACLRTGDVPCKAHRAGAGYLATPCTDVCLDCGNPVAAHTGDTAECPAGRSPLQWQYEGKGLWITAAAQPAFVIECTDAGTYQVGSHDGVRLNSATRYASAELAQQDCERMRPAAVAK